MAAEDRSFSDVVQDILRNMQEIVRSEVRLAKTEIGEEAVKAKSSAVLLCGGAAAAVYAILFLLLTAVFALTLVMPSWAAALIVGAALAFVAALLLAGGVKRFKQIHPTPERTVETIKENVEWAKHQAK
jgi:uncharacterized membrane protein YqjE